MIFLYIVFYILTVIIFSGLGCALLVGKNNTEDEVMIIIVSTIWPATYPVVIVLWLMFKGIDIMARLFRRVLKR